MEPEYSVITSEISAKGKGYLIIRRCGEEAPMDVVRRGAVRLLEAGAAQLYVTSADPAAPLAEGEGDRFRLAFCHDMLRMERPLTNLPRPMDGLTLEPLTRERGGQWLALYNEGFFNVPNSATYDYTNLADCLSEPCRCGFALADGVPVGVYELRCEGDCPEIEGIALIRDARGRGLGRALLRACMERLSEMDYGSCCLRVSTANQGACRLYETEGFVRTEVVSRWYQILAREDLRV